VVSPTTHSRRKCPNCGAARVVPIVYGEPKPTTTRAAELGLLMTWGCLVYDELPRWACLECEQRWGRLDDGDARAWSGAIGRAIRSARMSVSALL